MYVGQPIVVSCLAFALPVDAPTLTSEPDPSGDLFPGAWRAWVWVSASAAALCSPVLRAHVFAFPRVAIEHCGASLLFTRSGHHLAGRDLPSIFCTRAQCQN